MWRNGYFCVDKMPFKLRSLLLFKHLYLDNYCSTDKKIFGWHEYPCFRHNWSRHDEQKLNKSIFIHLLPCLIGISSNGVWVFMLMFNLLLIVTKLLQSLTKIVIHANIWLNLWTDQSEEKCVLIIDLMTVLAHISRLHSTYCPTNVSHSWAPASQIKLFVAFCGDVSPWISCLCICRHN